jgi:dethiobiotin synthetase
MTSLPAYPESHPAHPRALLRPFQGPGLFITGTGTDIGKTTVTAALAGALHRLHVRVGVCKPVASGCPKHSDRGNNPNVPLVDDDFVSPDGIIVGTAAGLQPLDDAMLRYISPVRFGAPLSPHIASEIEGRPTNWKRVAAALDWWQENSDVLVVEGAGGWFVPLDQHDFMVADLAAALRLPVIVVTDAELGTLNRTLLTVQAIRQKSLSVIGLVLNRVPPKNRDISVTTNLTELARLSGVPIRAILPLIKDPLGETIPPAFIDAMIPFAQEWLDRVRPTS